MQKLNTQNDFRQKIHMLPAGKELLHRHARLSC